MKKRQPAACLRRRHSSSSSLRTWRSAIATPPRQGGATRAQEVVPCRQAERMRPLGPGAGGRAHEHAGVAAPAGIERVGPRRLVAHALVQDARHIERRQVVTRVVERFERGQERERARHLRTPRFVLQVVKDQAVGSERGYVPRRRELNIGLPGSSRKAEAGVHPIASQGWNPTEGRAAGAVTFGGIGFPVLWIDNI
jgi:hypothetical protein